MTNLKIVPGDRLDVEMVRELRKLDKTFVIFGIAVAYMYVHFNHKIIKLEDVVSKMERDNKVYTDCVKEKSKED
jgi:hypothetical protein